MATTPNYNFSTVADSEFEKNLIDWVRELAGTGDTSTLMIIDRILAEHENAIGTKQMAVAGTDVVATASGDISAGGMVYVLQEGTVSRYSFGAANEHILPSTNVFRLSPDKSFAVVGGGSQPYAQYYKVSGNVLTYLCDIPSNADGAELDGSVLGAAFSPDGTMLVLTGKFTGNAKLYHVDGETMTYVCDLYEDADNTAFTKTIFAAAFSPDGTVLVLAGTFAHGAKKYAVSGGQATYVDEIDADNDGTSLMNMVSCIAFSADGAYMAMGGLLELEYGAKLYSVSGGTFTFLGNSSIDGLVYDVAFSPDGSHLLVIGDQEGYANVYSVSASGLTHLYNLLDGVENGNARSAAFSADGKTLIITGLFGAKAFDVNAADIQYRFDFADYTALGGACAELPDGVSWVIGALKYGPAQTVSPAMDGIPGSMYQIGISYDDIGIGENGTVRIIAIPAETKPIYTANEVGAIPIGDKGIANGVATLDAYGKVPSSQLPEMDYADAPFKPSGKSYLTFSSPSSFTLKVTNTTKRWDGVLEYFSAGKEWSVWDGTTTLTAVNNDGEYVLYLRGTGNTVITGGPTAYPWILTGSDIYCIGNIENLLDYATVESGGHPTMADYCYSSMFLGCDSLIQAPSLLATKLSNYCYNNMFSDCNSLTIVQDLPATTLANCCYNGMFYNCSSLTQAPALPATTLANHCYQYMFYNCSSLTQAPALPATTLANHCYQYMFKNCSGLTQAPSLPATTLADYCYGGMFASCGRLTQAPALPATTLSNYCYQYMFEECFNLIQAPALPATTLADYCYSCMFIACMSLTQVPSLPATKLAKYCYENMFNSCTKIKLSSTQTDEYTQEYSIPFIGVGTTAASALTDVFNYTGGTFTGTPEINTTYYLSNTNKIVREAPVDSVNGKVGDVVLTAADVGAKEANASDVFIATYGTTTSAEIEAAYQAGKAVFCAADSGMSTKDKLAPLYTRMNDQFHIFYFVMGQAISLYVCSADAWSVQTAKYTPATHASTHASGGSDEITPAAIGAIPTTQKGAASGVASLDENGKVPEAQIPNSSLKPQIIVTAPAGSNVTASNGGTVITAVEESGTWVFNVPSYGAWTITATLGTSVTSEVVTVTVVQQYEITLSYPKIYGVQWDGTSTTALTRTDAAAGFTDPVPYVAGATSYGSPFDNLQPWAGMVRVTDSEAGELVAIPKFWYKWTKSGNTLKLQISHGAQDGFFVSPAHADRGDGNGERDIVYVGRYHCSSGYKSTTGVAQQTNITRSTARTNIHNLGATIWQFDYAMRLTIQMLYLVEFADWNSQTKIGYGCSASGSKVNNGQTDAMQYHTGTTAANRTTYGFTQYRYIEGLWDNVYDWMDGCYYNSSGMNIILNPSKFSDSANGTSIGTPPGGWISAFNVVESGGVQWLCHSGNSGSDSTYIPDFWYFSASSPCLCCGGSYDRGLGRGLFFVYCSGSSDTGADIGCRLQKLT